MQDPREILKKYWGFPDFKGSQKAIITALAQGRDVLALMPTGGGKSLCYQVPALAMEGICIVISPLVALIQNQVDNLKQRGIKAIALTGGIPFDEVNDLLDNCMYGNYKFLYLSPERLQQELVQARLRQMNVNLIAVDEAHCISQWGHDFRPAYLQCPVLRGLLPNTPVIALTATATQQVAKDIQDNLKFLDPFIAKDSFSRGNIAFKVLLEEDKLYRLKQLVAPLAKSGIVYVRTRRSSQDIAQFLLKNGFGATFFHGGLTQSEKQERLHSWLENKTPIMVATNAFGMGIDKPDVELVVHFQIPDSLENYFQEAGRAGRDGSPAQAILLTDRNDEIQVRKQFLSVLPDTPFLKLCYNKLNNYFQIAYGEGMHETYPLNFNEFCDTYSLNPLLAYNTLRILDQNSVIALSESFTQKTTVRFISDKEELFDYFEVQHGIAPIAQSILRTYGGIFEYDTAINTRLISKKTGVPEKEVLKVLNLLHKDGVIDLKARDSDLEVTFLVPRDDDRTINLFARQVKELHRIKADKIESMLAYIHNEKICRGRQLLSYFGEQGIDCTLCDVCTKVQGATREIDSVPSKIMDILAIGPLTSRQLALQLPYDDRTVLTALRYLLEEEKIRINSKNEYQID